MRLFALYGKNMITFLKYTQSNIKSKDTAYPFFPSHKTIPAKNSSGNTAAALLKVPGHMAGINCFAVTLFHIFDPLWFRNVMTEKKINNYY